MKPTISETKLKEVVAEGLKITSAIRVQAPARSGEGRRKKKD
jgi:hypothetical protein